MAVKYKEVECDKKVEEADRALERALAYIHGIGEVGRGRIALLIERGEDGKDNPSGV